MAQSVSGIGKKCSQKCVRNLHEELVKTEKERLVCTLGHENRTHVFAVTVRGHPRAQGLEVCLFLVAVVEHGCVNGAACVGQIFGLETA